MTSELCFECDNRRLTLFYPHVESLILATTFGALLMFEDLSVGGWFQRACPYCADEELVASPFTLIVPMGGGEYGA